MIDQKFQATQIPLVEDQMKLYQLASSQANPQKEKLKVQQAKQPIFKIDIDFLDLQFKLNHPAYFTNAQLLNHTKIRPQDRQKLKSWILSETQNLYERETYAFASKYLDMFFSKGYKVQKTSFQALGIACLILAAKINQRRIPNISFQVFDKNQIFRFQRTLFEIFNFKVNPITYVSLSQLLFYLWDNYQAQNNPFRAIKYFQQGIQSIKMIRSIMETLDCMDLVHQTLNIPLSSLVCNVFFVQNRKFCLINKRKSFTTKQLLQIDTQYQFHEYYQNFMIDFIKHVKKISSVFAEAQINIKYIAYIMYFSRISPKIKVNPKYKHFIFQINRQTYNPEICSIAQNYLCRIS